MQRIFFDVLQVGPAPCEGSAGLVDSGLQVCLGDRWIGEARVQLELPQLLLHLVSRGFAAIFFFSWASFHQSLRQKRNT